MKQPLLCILILCLPIIAFSQTTEYGSFKIDGTEIIFQKVITVTGVSHEKLAEFLKKTQYVSNVNTNDGKIEADLADFVVDFKKFQFSQVAVPNFIQTGRFGGKISAEVRDGRYRVTIREFTMKGNIGYKEIASPEPMTNYACTNSGTVISRDWCKPNTLGLLEQALTDLLTYKESKDSDW